MAKTDDNNVDESDDFQHNDQPEEEAAEQLAEGTLVSHLVELRTRVMKAGMAVLVVFICLAPFAKKIYAVLSVPLQKHLPEDASMIATGVTSPFLTPFKLTLFVALFIAIPVVLYQAWAFVAPGLYRKEQKFAIPLVVSSVLLFYLGIAFAYFVVFSLMFSFFAGAIPEGVTWMTDISQYLDFVLSMFLAFGIAFEVPIATVLLVATGLVTRQTLGKLRAYVFLGAFVGGMLLTPPDAISQTLLAVPVYLLYEIGLLLSRVFVKEPWLRRDDDDDDDDADDDDAVADS
jgi:sec-independent protein translocase protein TatC